MNTRTMGSSSRLVRRLLIFVWAALLLGATGAKATPVKTLVQDTLYRADGSAAQGEHYDPLEWVFDQRGRSRGGRRDDG